MLTINGKLQMTERELNDRVKDWTNAIAYAARNPAVTVERTEQSIGELIAFILRERAEMDEARINAGLAAVATALGVTL